MNWDPGTLKGDLILRRYPVGPLFMNAYLLFSPSAGQCLLIDPGDDPQYLLDEIDRTGYPLVQLLCTHAHFDHISGAAEIQRKWETPLLVHQADAPVLGRLAESRATFGFPPVDDPAVTFYDGPQSSLEFAGHRLGLQHAPGHCPGHVLLDLGGAMIVGDVIFEESIGRTDLPGGSFAVLEKSIREKIYTLPGDTKLHPGHGPSTTVDHEIRHNPFVRG